MHPRLYTPFITSCICVHTSLPGDDGETEYNQFSFKHVLTCIAKQSNPVISQGELVGALKGLLEEAAHTTKINTKMMNRLICFIWIVSFSKSFLYRFQPGGIPNKPEKMWIPRQASEGFPPAWQYFPTFLCISSFNSLKITKIPGFQVPGLIPNKRYSVSSCWTDR